MSKFSNIIRLCPTTSDDQTEVIYPDVTFPCPFCMGNGWTWDIMNGDPCKQPCKRCYGTGKVKAKVTIQWSPTGDPISIFKEGEE